MTGRWRAYALVAPALSGVARTPFRGLKSLEPGTLLEVRAGGMRVVRQARFRFRATCTSATPEALQAALASAVSDRLAADVEVAMFSRDPSKTPELSHTATRTGSSRSSVSDPAPLNSCATALLRDGCTQSRTGPRV